MITSAQTFNNAGTTGLAGRGTMEEFSAASTRGMFPESTIPWMLMHQDVIRKLYATIEDLKKKVATHDAELIGRLAAPLEVPQEDEPNSELSTPLSASAVALVNSLLASVPEERIFREEIE